LPRWAALKVRTYEPADQLLTDWVNEPVVWRKATCVPSGADGLPLVKPLLLAAMPEEPEKVQGDPDGRYWN
jgi:hypothetical protein